MTDVTDAAAADLVTILTNARDAGYSPEMMLDVAARALARAEGKGREAERKRVEGIIRRYSLMRAEIAHDIAVCDNLLAALAGE